MKIKLKHLAAYLPYELKILNTAHPEMEKTIIYTLVLGHNGYYQKEKLMGIDFWSSSNGYFLHHKHLKPILRPLSDLTKEIEVDGKKFMPHTKLFSNIDDKDMKIWWYQTEMKLISGNYKLVEYDIIQELLALHFDIFGLIEKGLAVDMNWL